MVSEMALCFGALAAAAALHTASAQPPPLPAPPADVSAAKSWWDCAMRTEALALAAELQPFRTTAELQLVADALAGAPEVPAQCQGLTAAGGRTSARPVQPDPVDPARSAAAAFGCKTSLFVSSANGDDGAPGTLQRPLRSVAKGVAAMRSGPPGRCLLLRAGTFFLPETLVLDASSSGLTIAAVPGEKVVLSGGEPLLGGAWTAHTVDAANWSASNIWAAQLPAGTAAVQALRVAGGRRAIRALYPNHVPELGFGAGLTANDWFPLAAPRSNVTELWPAVPLQRETANESAVCNEQQGGAHSTVLHSSRRLHSFCQTHPHPLVPWTHRPRTVLPALLPALPPRRRRHLREL